MTWRIRSAVKSDETAIQACADAAYTRYIATIGRKPAPMTADYAGHIARREVTVVVEDDDALLGFLVMFAEDGHMQLENVAVHPTSAGQGIGKALVKFCEDAARHQGLRAVRLYTNEKMTENLTIYSHFGYREIGRWQEDGFNRAFFEKALM